ncbi:ATP-binding cassette domain-containing protein [Companilactobacillus hulinensis]|uniref:ATP-binding cassette domain-containing protein n=1 Tax=Companilactobacillus hulinensis TaxID=2486007 RepID=UPI000F7AA7CE|nr:ATP-binding cassette domain-containing protein [Companilactobacillus hulinensis]
MVEIVRFKNYSFKYANSQKLSLNNVDLTINKGDFLLLIGKTGSGKSTLLKQLKPDLIVGDITNGNLDCQIDDKNISYISQFVDNQMITECARDEFNFILENMGYSADKRHMKIAEVASYFGIIDLLDLTEQELSGGQKQLINLASALILNPDILLLDEPTSQLDPIAAEKLIQMIHKINSELNMTIVLVEHSLERNVFFANRLAIVENGSIMMDETVDAALRKMFQDDFYKNYLSQIDRSCMELKLKSDKELPLSNRQFSKLLTQNKNEIKYSNISSKSKKTDEVLSVKKLSFRFDFESKKLIDYVSFQLNKGNSYCIVGPNGVGKSTMIRVITQQLKQQSGRIKLDGNNVSSKNNDIYQKMFVLPQNPALLFVSDTVFGEVEFQLKQKNPNIMSQQVELILQQYDMLELKDTSPYDLSGGQQEFLALIIGLIKEPEILFLDEPTKGLDPNMVLKLNELLEDYLATGGIVFANSHDLVFATNFNYVSLMFDGKLSEFKQPVEFFKDKFFYTTEINKASRDSFPDALTWNNLKKI